MPKIFKEKENSDQKINQEKDISPEQLIAQESLLLNNLEKSQKDLPEDQFQLLIDRIFEHSAADGLKYANQLGLNRSQVAHSISQPKFYLKHEKLAKRILSEVNSNSKYISHENFSEFTKGSPDKALEELAGDNLNPVGMFKKVSQKYSSKVLELKKEIDDYYLNFFKLQNVKLENPGNSIVSKDALILEQLEASKLALTNNYYSGDVLNILFKNLIHEDGEKIKETAEKYFKNDSSLKDKYNNDFDRYYNSLIRGSIPSRDITLNYLGKDKEGKKIVDIFKNSNLIDQEGLDTIGKKYKLSDEIDKKKIESAKYKPLDLVYKTRKEMAKAQVIDDLKKSLASRFGEEKKIVFDKESCSYVVDGLRRKEASDTLERKIIETKVIYTTDKGEIFFANQGASGNINVCKSYKNISKYVVFDNKGEKIGDEYSAISSSININNQIYLDVIVDNKNFVIDQKGNKIGGEYDAVRNLTNINNQLYFRADKAKNSFVVGPDGQKISKDYDFIVSIRNINNQLYYVAENGKGFNKDFFLIGPDEKQIGDEYQAIDYITTINNQTYFAGKQNNRWYIFGPDGKPTSEKGYGFINTIRSINNQLYFEAYQDGRQYVFDKEGNKISGEYVGAFSLTNINNQLYFKAEKNDTSVILGSDGRKVSGEYQEINLLTDIGGKLYFAALNEGKYFVIGTDNKQIGGGYDAVGNFTNLNNEIYFIAKDGNKCFVIGPDGEKIGKGYEQIHGLTNFNNKIYFIGKENDKYFVVGPDGKEIGDGYGAIGTLSNVNDCIYFKASIGRDAECLIGPNGQKVGKTFNRIKDPININNQVYFEATEFGATNAKSFVIGPDNLKISDDFDQIHECHYNKETNQLFITGLKDNSIIHQRILIESAVEDLTTEEEKKLDLLNLIYKPNLAGVSKYLEESPIINKKSNHKLSDKEVFRLNETLNSDKSLLLETYPAKKDRSVAELSARFLYKIFPEVLENKIRARDNKSSFWSRMGFSGGGGFGGGSSNGGESGSGSGGFANNSSRNRESANTYEGGGFSENGKAPEKVLSSKENIEGILATNIFGKYENNKWQKIEFKIDNEANLPQKEITVTLHNIGNSLNMSLPKPLEGRIISERVKGIKADGSEINLDVQINALQEATCISSENVKEIVYSFKVSEVFEPLVDISNLEYDNYVSKLEYKKELTNNIAELPEDLQFLINSLKNKSPKEKIITIENYVKENSYYDFNNKETINLKKGKNITEIIDIMELRVQELNEGGKVKTDKKYAGVCADFALLTTALLRQANIASGYLTGYGLNGEKTATTESAHGCSFVLYPDNKGKTRLISVDGTPSSSDEEGGQVHFSEPSLEEKEKEVQEVKEEKEKEAFEELEKIEKIIASHSEAEINKLNNGKLEEVLNNILRYSVNENNLETIETVLNAYWYSPLKDMDIDSLDDNLKATSFIKQEMDILKLKTIKGDSHYKLGEAGSKLFNVSQDFIRRFAGRKSDSDSLRQGLKILEKVYDLSKNNLNEIERKTLLTIVRYLEAKNITGKK